MPQTRSSERGITILETTVILSVLFILAGAMSPIVSESVATARAVKAKNDASMIAMGLINLQKDLGQEAMSLGAGPQRSKFPEVLASDGASPSVAAADEDQDAAAPAPLVSLLPSSDDSKRQRAPRALRRRWREVPADALDDHLRTNRRGYRLRRPGQHAGWNGPYISTELDGDPWGNQYLINSRWIDGGSSIADADGKPRRAVFVLSAGADGVIDTPFEQSIVDARAYGDDIAIRIQ